MEAVDKLKIWPKDKVLFKDLMSIYNEGFTKTNLYSYRQFYKIFPQIFHAVSGKSALYFRGHITECLRLLYVSGIGCDGVSGGAVKD